MKRVTLFITVVILLAVSTQFTPLCADTWSQTTFPPDSGVFNNTTTTVNYEDVRLSPYSNWTQTGATGAPVPNISNCLAFPGSGNFMYFIGIAGKYFYRYSLPANSWTSLITTNLPPQNIGAGGCLTNCSYDGRLYAFAGGNTRYFFRYNINYGSNGSWSLLPNSPQNINDGAALAFSTSDNYLYAFAGGNTGYFMRFNVATSQWDTSFNNPAPVSIGTGGSLAYSGIDNRIYGFAGGNTTTFLCYDIQNSAWTNLTNTPAPGNINNGGSLTYSSYDKCIYALQGGSSPANWRYTPGNPGIWTTLPNTPGNIGAGGAIVSAGSCQYVLQGNNSSASYRYSVLTTNTWANWGTGPSGIGNGGASVYHRSSDRFYTQYGNGSTTFANWPTTQNPVFTQLTPVPQTVLLGGALATSKDGTIYSLPGNSQPYFYSYSSGTWTRLSDAPGNIVRGSALVYSMSNDSLYAIQGNGYVNFWQFPLPNGPWVNRQSLPSSVDTAGTAIVCPGGNYIYMWKRLSPYFLRYDIANNVWITTLAQPPAQPGSAGASMTYPGSGDFIYASRGYNGVAQGGEYWAYSISGNFWVQLPKNTLGDPSSGGGLIYPSTDNYAYFLQGYNLNGSAIWRIQNWVSASPGNYTSNIIGPATAWGTLTYNGILPSGSTILNVDVLDPSSGNPFPGGSGLGSPTDLSSIVPAGSAIKLRANLSTNDTSLTPALSDWSVNYRTVANLVFIQQPINTVAGATISPAVTVKATDANNNIVPNAPINLTCNGTLNGTLTRYTDTNGIATFNDLSINQAGNNYILTAHSGSVSQSSDQFSITPASADHLSYIQQPTDTQSGEIINPAVVVGIYDLYNNPVPNASISIATTDNTIYLGGTLTKNSSSNGTASFDDLWIIPTGAYTLKASSGALALNSNSFNITNSIIDNHEGTIASS